MAAGVTEILAGVKIDAGLRAKAANNGFYDINKTKDSGETDSGNGGFQAFSEGYKQEEESRDKEIGLGKVARPADSRKNGNGGGRSKGLGVVDKLVIMGEVGPAFHEAGE